MVYIEFRAFGCEIMELKKIVPVLAMMVMMCMCVVSMQPASAHQTVLKAYHYDPNDPPGTEIANDLTIKKGEDFQISATLHVDGGNPQWFRYIHFYAYDSKGDQIANDLGNSGFGGVAGCWIHSKDWEPGNYTMSVIYWGNERDGYPRADKDFILHIV